MMLLIISEHIEMIYLIGTVDAFSKEEVVDDYNEYSYLNNINRDVNAS